MSLLVDFEVLGFGLKLVESSIYYILQITYIKKLQLFSWRSIQLGLGLTLFPKNSHRTDKLTVSDYYSNPDSDDDNLVEC